MPKPDLIICVVSCSRGCAPAVLNELTAAAEGVPGADLADITHDVHHGLAQFTLTGSDAGLVAAARALAAAAAGHGAGAGLLAEIAFVPVGRAQPAAGEQRAAELAHRTREALSAEAWPPVTVCARPARVVFHIELDRDDPALAERLARTVSDARSGFPAVEARLCPPVPGRGTEIEVHLLDPGRTPLVPVFAALEILSREAGSMCVASRLAGLAPRAVLTRGVAEDIHMHDFDPELQQLERVVRRSPQPC